jgi:hypothetical protein
MRKLLLPFLFLLLPFTGNSQYLEQVYLAAEVTWFGIDFSRAKMVGDFGDDNTGNSLRDKYFEEWNKLILDEPGRYELALFFHKRVAHLSLEKVTEQNRSFDATSLLLPSGSMVEPLKKTEIEEMAIQYSDEKEKGIGVFMIVESFDKSKALGALDLVFFDRRSGFVYFAKRFHKVPEGFGIRNFWAKTIYLALDETYKSWNKWRKEEDRKK